ncbi:MULTISPECIES: hypothetical protein [unclassified Micromonospora]|uniref:hypothetical protein n=1 Tax=unclassified Micromonospora TaxID=2617518 RepID=UPI00332F4B62
MPSIVVKPQQGRDLYVIWSTITECPIAWGDRAETLEWLHEDWQCRQPGVIPDLLSDPAGRLDRADIYGTSAAGGYAFFGRWDYDGFMYEQRGILPRHLLARACELLEADREPEVWDLLEPIEEGMEVRRG